MKIFLSILKLHFQYCLFNNSLMRIFIFYALVNLTIIYLFTISEALSFILFLKIIFPILFIIPTIKVTLLNKGIKETILKIIKQYGIFNPEFILYSRLLTSLVISVAISLPFWYPYIYYLLMGVFSISETIFEIFKFINILLFFNIVALWLKSRATTMSDVDVISKVFILDIFLTIGLFIIDFLSKSFFNIYLGKYFGTHPFIKLSFFVFENKNVYSPYIDNDPLISGISNDMLLSIILALSSLTILYRIIKSKTDINEI